MLKLVDVSHMYDKPFSMDVLFVIDLSLEDVLSYLEYINNSETCTMVYPIYTGTVEEVPDFSEVDEHYILSPLYLPDAEKHLHLVKASLDMGQVEFYTLYEKYKGEKTW